MRVKRDIVISDFAGDRLKETNTCRINLVGKNSHFAGAKKYAGEGFGGFFFAASALGPSIFPPRL